MDKEDMRNSLNRAQQEIMRLGRMVDQAIEFPAVSETVVRHMEPIDAAPILRAGAEIYRAILEKRGNALTLDIPGKLPDIYGNADMIFQTLANLFSNAVHHTENGEIAISAKAENGTVSVTVKDNGEGIKPEFLPFLFLRGVSTRGTGYGLSICKSVIDAHKGEIRLDSEYGKGTSVTFTLPIYK
jgi:two-component system sensor histidine kinase VicK